MRMGRQKFSFLCTASNLRSHEITVGLCSSRKKEVSESYHLFSLSLLSLVILSRSLSLLRTLSLALLCGGTAGWRSWSLVGMCMARCLC
jgi:hypothetical protein